MTEAPSAAGSDGLPQSPAAGSSAAAGPEPGSSPQSVSFVGLKDSVSVRPRPVPSVSSAVLATIVTLCGFAILGLLGAHLWAGATDLPAYLVTGKGDRLDELQLGRFFNSPGWFLLVGLGLGLLGGLAFGAVYRRHGWVIVAGVFAGGLLASYLCYHYGTTLDKGPVGPRLRAAHPGDRVPVQLSLGADGVRLAWPIAALMGVLIAQYALWRKDESASVPLRSRPHRRELAE